MAMRIRYSPLYLLMLVLHVSPIASQPPNAWWDAGEQPRRNRGNASWGKLYVPVRGLPTEFEQQLEELGLHPGEYQASF